jgi:hypothetical protein
LTFFPRRGSFFFLTFRVVVSFLFSIAPSLGLPSFANARQRQAATHVSSLNDAADSHWMDMDDLYLDPTSRHDPAYGLLCVCVYVSLWFSNQGYSIDMMVQGGCGMTETTTATTATTTTYYHFLGFFILEDKTLGIGLSKFCF